VNRIGWLLLGLVGVLWLAVELADTTTSAPPGLLSTWRRTSDGWEKLPHLAPCPENHQPSLHPVVVAAAQLLFSLLALAAWDHPTNKRAS